VAATTSEDIRIALKKKDELTVEQLEKRLPLEIQDITLLFFKQAAKELAPHRLGINHRIEVCEQPDGSPTALLWGLLYSMSKDELLVLKKSLNDLQEKGYIRLSTLEAAAPVLFVRKLGEGLRFCCDYRALNAITKPDRYPLPLIPETLQNLTGAK
jgi:hypothetical protein